jgi:DNA mismatch repair protein MutH
MQMVGMQWKASSVYKKLARVLWIPVQSEPQLPVSERRIGNPLLWSPNQEQEEALRQDWEELAEWISLGKVEHIHGRLGKCLQIRPKAANAKELCAAIGIEGNKIQTLPRGFYLRASFTAEILRQHYKL